VQHCMQTWDGQGLFGSWEKLLSSWSERTVEVLEHMVKKGAVKRTGNKGSPTAKGHR